MLLYSNRIKPKNQYPWKINEIISMLQGKFIWEEIIRPPRVHDGEPGWELYGGRSVILKSPQGDVILKQNRDKIVRDLKEGPETEYEHDTKYPANCTIIETDNQNVIKFLLSQPQFSK